MRVDARSIACSSFFGGFSFRSGLSPCCDLIRLDDHPILNSVKSAYSLSSIRISKASNLTPIRSTDAIASLGTCREITERRLEDSPQECWKLSDWRSSDDVVGPRWEFASRFAEGIEKLAGNTSGDRRKKTRRLMARMPEAI
ncbi:hypothetical protein GW17_00048434 [Ensete ventricosum]|nr:hypothetical protein GW17_00048434 [Ensete ventricosum]